MLRVGKIVSTIALILFVTISSSHMASAALDPDIGGISGKVVGADGQAIAGATITITGRLSTRVVSGADGTFVLSPIPIGIYTMVVSKQGYNTATVPDLQIVGPNTAVVATLIPVNPTNVKQIGKVSIHATSGINLSAAPVTIVNAQTFRDQAEITWRRVLEEIPGVVVMGSPTSALGDVFGSPSTTVTVSIRGAQNYETATLLDGHHFYGEFSPGTGVTELQGLDPAMFSRVDVVRGPGASSPTINNAIGGALNFIADEPLAHNGGIVQLQNDGYGGLISSVGYGGFAANRRLDYHVYYGATNFYGPLHNALSRIEGGSFSEINGQPFFCNCFATSNPNPAYIFQTPDTTEAIACCGIEDTSDSRNSLGARFGYQISPVTRTSAMLLSTSDITNSPDVPYREKFAPPPGYTGAIPPGQSSVNFALNFIDIFRAHYPVFEYNFLTKVANVDLRYSYLSYHYYSDRVYVPRTLGSITLFGGGCIASTPGGTGGCPPGFAPIVLNGQVVTPGQFFFAQQIHNDEYSRDSIIEASLPTGRNLASISYEVTSIVPNYTGSFNFVGPSSPFTTFAILTGRYGRYSEFRLRDIVKLSDQLELTGAFYMNHYLNHVLSDTAFGQPSISSPNPNTLVDKPSYFSAPRFGVVYRPVPNAAVRFADGRSISPVPLSILDQVPTPPVFMSSCGCYVETISPGPMQPEVGNGYDLGADYQFPRSRDIISIDGYSTLLRNQFYSTQSLVGKFAGLPLFGSQERNFGQSTYRGLEFIFRRAPDVGFGATASLSLMRAYVYNLPPGFFDSPSGPMTNNLGVVPDINFNGFAGIAQRVPYAQGYVEFNYHSNLGLFASLGLNYYGNNNAYYRPAFVTLNPSIRVPLTADTSLQISGHNLTNAYGRSFVIYSEVVPLPYGNKLFPGTPDSPGPSQVIVTLSQKL